MEKDHLSNVKFVEMESVSLMFDARPLFSEVIAKTCEELQWNSNEDALSVEGVVHYDKSRRVFSRLVKITCEAA